MKQIRGSNSSFFKNKEFHTESSAGCPRIALLRSHGLEEPKNTVRTRKTFALGHVNEEIFCEHYMADILHLREKAIEEKVTDQTVFIGHSDVVTQNTVFELKSVSSKGVWEGIKEGRYKKSNLAQLVNYMISLEYTKGYLVYSLYAYVDGIDLADIFFEVEIREDGGIYVDGNYSDYTVKNLLDARKEMAAVVEENKVFPRRPKSGKSGACKYCPFSKVCKEIEETGETDTEKFLNQTKEIINEIRERNVQVQQRRQRKAKETFS